MFGVPIRHILEIVGAARPQPVPLAPIFVGGLVHYRGAVSYTHLQRTDGVTLLKSRVTGVVDLDAVAPLPAGEQAPAEWNQVEETVA